MLTNLREELELFDNVHEEAYSFCLETALAQRTCQQLKNSTGVYSLVYAND
ncbi:hypothetical protein [Pseudoalteromonas sp. MMG012]|uniref:hypothetical protein n=1 Tax=Pseudoalteromonas sp. MMG012 TaxID=2822686 RepID=UPI001B39DEEB|nr:hypothetical protein [Pseudoalteromonas sp. MMG012]MBQ4852776.1 hypothetical protein [Pseudoalteromonas sp. MMG012]